MHIIPLIQIHKSDIGPYRCQRTHVHDLKQNLNYYVDELMNKYKSLQKIHLLLKVFDNTKD